MSKADLILKSNAIFTGKSNSTFAGGIAIKGNRIIKVGSTEDIEGYRDSNTVVFHYGDNLILPGFIDSHMHYFVGAFQSSGRVCRELFESRSKKECLNMVGAFADANPQMKAIVGMGWHLPSWKEADLPPCKEDLDKIEPQRPIFLLSAEGHTFWLNSKALELCHIHAGTTVSFGSIGKDSTGNPNGLLYELEACEEPNTLAFKAEGNEGKKIFLAFNKQLSQCGITSTTDVSTCPEPVGDFSQYELLHQLETEKKLSVRIHLYPSLGLVADTTLASQLRDKYHSEKLRIAGLKQFVDGVTSSNSAFLLAPYTDNPSISGNSFYAYEVLRDCISKANKDQFGVKLHAIGDAAIRMALNAFEESQKKNGPLIVRNSIEHVEAPHPDDIKRFAELNVTAAMQPLHMSYENLEKLVKLGPQRSKYQFPFKTLLEHGSTLAFGTDYPVVPFNPMETIYAAVSRTTIDNQEIEINPWEKIPLADALRAYTYGSAYCVNQEKVLGSIEEGKLADIVVLDRNLFAVDPKEILETKVLLTIMDGTIVHQL